MFGLSVKYINLFRTNYEFEIQYNNFDFNKKCGPNPINLYFTF